MTAPRKVRAISQGLSFESIVEAASELIEAEGFEALTMRRLAQRCGVGAMTLYGYVRTKEELLGALADRALAEVELPDAEGLTWQERVAEVYRSVRRVFHRHRELASIVATQPIDSLAAYRGAEVVFGALAEAGLSDEDAVAGFETLTSFTAGFTLRETARAADIGPGMRSLRTLPAGEFSHVVRVAGLLAARDSETHFERGLAAVIRGIAP